jgi:GDP-L-fucose synthase
MMQQVTGFKGIVKFNSSMPNGIHRKLLSSSKALSLGWAPNIPLREGLEATYSWFQNAYADGNIRGK